VFKVSQTPILPLSIFFLFSMFLSSSMALDPHEVTNRDYQKFIRATGHSSPEYWSEGHYPKGMEDDPVVLVTWYDAIAYCRWVGDKRLPTVDEWMSICKAGKLEKQGNVWEWTSSDVKTEEGTYKALCGPMGICDCSHQYLPEWKNMVKGFRCTDSSLHMTSLSSQN